MSTPQTASICVKNLTNSEADIVLIHKNEVYPPDFARWTVPANGVSDFLVVHFNTGIGSWTQTDDWSIMLFIKEGPEAGTYWNEGTGGDCIVECQLQSEDAGQYLTFTVNTSCFSVLTDSSPQCSDMMMMTAPPASAPISHIFVVMLENHSFDNMLAFSGIPGIRAATKSDSNSYGGTSYPVIDMALNPMPSDPGHEFFDVLLQLTGKTSFAQGETYGPITNENFVASYATSTSEWPNQVPQKSAWEGVMACMNASQVPNLVSLAKSYAVCDSWFSSLPGPTWPNRFFVHGASSANLVDSPTSEMIEAWETTFGGGFVYPNGSIYDRLSEHGIQHAIYHDDVAGLSGFSHEFTKGSVLGSIPQVQAIYGISGADNEPLATFPAALQGPYPYAYTFIEPHYGDVGDSYQGGSSQHPMDYLDGGETLLNAVYDAIKTSPLWESSLLIVIYDEHGGFYDSVAPGAAVAPGDNPDTGFPTNGFDFTTYGVRVPAVVVSPLIPAGTVSHTVYDHGSVPATLEALWGLAPLTQRDANAASVLPLLTLSSARRDGATMVPPNPAPEYTPPTPEQRAVRRARPIPRQGNLVGTIGILRKLDREVAVLAPDLASEPPVIATVGDAEEYALRVRAKLATVRERRAKAALAARVAALKDPCQP